MPLADAGPGEDADAGYVRIQKRQWEGFYDWMQEHLQEPWAQRYGLILAGGVCSYRALDLQPKPEITRYSDQVKSRIPSCPANDDPV